MGKKPAQAKEGAAPEAKPEAKAKAPAKPVEPKAKADPAAPPKAKAAAAPAAAAPPAAAKGAAAKAPAKAGAAAPKGKAKAAPAPAEKAAAPPPKAGAAKAAPAPSAKGGAKAGAAPAPAGKAGAKAKAKEAPFVPPPREEEPEEEGDFETAKKKKNRRGGRNKKAEEEVDGAEEQVAVPDMADALAKAQEQAEKAADKDADLLALRERVKAVEVAEKNKTGTADQRAKELAVISEDIEKQIAAKKAEAPKKAHPSHKCEQQIEELKVLRSQGGDIGSMLSEMETKLADAKKAEALRAVGVKLSYLQERVKKTVDQVKAAKAAAATTATAAAAADGGKGAGGLPQAAEERLERRLKEKHSGNEDAKLITETLELAPDVMKYLFGMPEMFKIRFERENPVLLEPVRGPKGSGKGKGAPSKEFVVAGLNQGEVDKVVTALKALDFSGTQTKEVSGSVMSSFSRSKEIEAEYKVLAYKSGTQLTLYGSKANVPKAFEAVAKADAAKAEESKVCVAEVEVDLDKVKVMKASPGGLRQLLGGWKGETDVRIKIPEFGEDDDGKAKKIRLTSKTQAEVDVVKKKVDDFMKSMSSEFVEGDTSKINGKGSSEPIRTAFKTLRDGTAVRIDRRDGGFQLIGPKKEIGPVKTKLLDLFKKANFEPAKVGISAEQRRVFPEEKMQEISKSTGADVKRNNLSLVIIGDEGQIEAAKKEIESVIEKEGTVDSISASDDTIKALTASRAAKLKDFQSKTNTTISADPKEGKVSVLGSAKGVEQAKKELLKFAEQIEKDQADTIAREMKVKLEDIPRIIGTKGSTLQRVREECGVQVRVGRDDGTVEIKGVESSVNAAEKMITDILAGASEKEVPEAKAKAKPARKKAEEYKGSADDFPTLGGEAGAPKEAPTWGTGTTNWAPTKKDVAPEEAAAESFPTLGGKAPAAKSTPAPAPKPAAKEEPAMEEEEEEAGDVDDPFAMMGGMGEETVYKVTLLEDHEDAPAEEEPAATNGDAQQEEAEEEEAGDFDDPFAMMGGMGEEQVYKVTLLDDHEDAPAPKTEAPKPAEQKPEPVAVPAAETEDAGFQGGGDDDFPALGGPPAGGARRGGKGARR